MPRLVILRFLTKDNLCTRFATELILKRGGNSTNIGATIVSDPNRNDEGNAQLQVFQPPSIVLEDFTTTVETAEKRMKTDASNKLSAKMSYVLNSLDQRSLV